MADTVSINTRSRIMKAVGTKNTKPEMIIRKFLFANGFRYRLHSKKLPGTPDIVLPKYKTAIFVNGCFWHGHTDCNKATIPKSNIDFWIDKIEKNKNNDSVNIAKLNESDWNAITIWQCELSRKNQQATLLLLKKKLIENTLKHPTLGMAVDTGLRA